MKSIRQLGRTFTALLPQRLSATPAARILRSLARQARQAVRHHPPKRHPGTPAPTPTMELNDAQSGPGPEVYKDWLTSIRGKTEIVAQPSGWEAAYDEYYADTGTVSAPQIQPPAPEAQAQLDGIVNAHEGVTKAMTSAGQNPAFNTRVRDMVNALQQATESIAAIKELKAGAADARTDHLQAIKGYEASLSTAYRHAVVLRADILSKGGNDKAMDPLITKLAEQKKAVAAYIRLLEV